MKNGLKRLLSILFSGLFLISCGGGSSENPQPAEDQTGAIAFQVIFQPKAGTAPERLPASLSSCHDIQRVAVSIFDNTGDLIQKGEWPCSDHRGTIDGITVGIKRTLLIQGIQTNGSVQNVLYEGQQENIRIEANKTTEIGTVIAYLLDKAPANLADQDGDGFTPVEGDCDDHNRAIRPQAAEACNSVDDNCNGQTDEGVLVAFYQDGDGDGHGTVNQTALSCSAPAGYVSSNDDCSDADKAIHPGAVESACNAKDEDCSGADHCPAQPNTYYQDADGDGFGNPANTVISANGVPSGYVTSSSDCDDTSAAVRPGAAETCNSVDDDCDGTLDDGVLTTYYRDADQDGYGTATLTSSACAPPAGYKPSGTDCNDANATIHPNAAEQCNERDDNCNQQIDETVQTIYYRDADGDGYGNPAAAVPSCAIPAGYVADQTDCNDTNAAVRPGATESCNTFDDDCDHDIDEGVQTTFYRDADGDGYGVASPTTLACSAPAGYAANTTDCNDGNDAVHPGATEHCTDGIDQDCDPNDGCLVTLPSLANMTMNGAQSIIAQHELVVGTYNYECNETTPSGLATRQVPPAGTQLRHGAVVNLYFSTGWSCSSPRPANSTEAKIGPSIDLLLD
jgi:hypothetical protein